MAHFSVDTNIFRQLGEFLVGRDSTALVELVKNSYDADSRAVLIDGSNLADPESSRIEIIDNGCGMTVDEFEQGFLRIATRIKTEGSRRSAIFQRRFTGEKGIGRLALHKLARQVQIVSFKWNGEIGNGIQLPARNTGFRAKIDWDLIEKKQTLDEIEATDAIVVETEIFRNSEQGAGTKILLRKLRNTWAQREISKFHDDVATLVPPYALVTKIPSTVLSKRLIFDTPKYRDDNDNEPSSQNFHIKLLGDLAYSASFMASEINAANWILEIDSDSQSRTIRYHIAPTRITLEKYPDSTPVEFARAISASTHPICFQARILQKDFVRWGKRYQGIRVYMEGFRVLPYGEPTDDWLGLNGDYANRAAGRFESLGHEYDDLITHDAGAALVIQPNSAYFGGVFLTFEKTPQLRMLINREGFLPSSTMDSICQSVRVGLDLLVRLRYAATKKIKRSRRKKYKDQRKATKNSDVREQPSAATIRNELKEIRKSLNRATLETSSGNVKLAGEILKKSDEQFSKIEESIAEVTSEAAMLRVLATVGTELAAFSHEINGVLELASALKCNLDRILRYPNLEKSIKANLRQARNTAHGLCESLARQAVYLVDITSVDARRRRSRQVIADRFDAASNIILNAAYKRKIKIDNDIDRKLKTPPMFPAEVTAVFTNLLTNAIKFSNDRGRIKTTGKQSNLGVFIRVENEGEQVELYDAEKWFRPFQSTTTDVDATLGQGMGLGLTITRSILDEYGAQIKFVKPSKNFDAALEILFPDD